MCRRRALGPGSADHLYIKRQLRAWLADQDIPASAAIPRDADGPRLDEVLLEPQGRGCLRVLLDYNASASLASADTGLLVLGEDITADPAELLRAGYVHRIRCVPDGTARRVQLGTEHHDGTDWFELAECELAHDGLTTPTTRKIRRLRTDHRPLGLLPRDTQAASVTVHNALPRAAEQPADDRAEAITALRTALNDGAGLTDLIHGRDRTEAATAPARPPRSTRCCAPRTTPCCA
ncbi:hypothetical protein [Yinghuangia aomiensis]|uniref:hypothetical protein n=1 Tax=Yinghuangia aomiensis TaxID=676205 RepID=UPI0031E759F7